MKVNRFSTAQQVKDSLSRFVDPSYLSVRTIKRQALPNYVRISIKGNNRIAARQVWAQRDQLRNDGFYLEFYGYQDEFDTFGPHSVRIAVSMKNNDGE